MTERVSALPVRESQPGESREERLEREIDELFG